MHTPWPLRLVLFRYRHVTSNYLQLLSLQILGLFITLTRSMLVKSICQSILRPRLGLKLSPLRGVHTSKASLVTPSDQMLIATAASDSALSPALLTRARLLAAEHTKLAERLGESFDAKTAKRAGELAPIANILKEWVNANDVCALETFIGALLIPPVYRRAQISINRPQHRCRTPVFSNRRP